MTAGRSWDPEGYLGFGDHRARPFADLLARVGARDPRHVVDLGCGPGHLTGALAARWPGARVSAVDSSPEMVAAARGRGVDVALADVADWTPAADVDVIVSNAVLHWVPGHDALLTRWTRGLPPGGWLAVQVPGNQRSPSHVLVDEVAADARWRERLAGREALTVGTPTHYADLLAATGADVDTWETTYLHRLTGEDPVLAWISSTTLRPVRDALGPEDYAAYRADLAPRLRSAYPRRPDGTTWFGFRRVFAVARRPTRR